MNSTGQTLNDKSGTEDDSLFKADMQFRWIAENFPNGSLFLIGPDYRICFAGGRELTEFGINPAELIGQSVIEVLPVHDIPAFTGFLKDLFESKSPVVELGMCHGIYKVSGRYTSGDGNDTGTALVVFQNISDSINAQSRIKFKASVLRNVTDAVIVKDLDGVICYWNDSASAIFGYSEEEMTGQSIGKILSRSGNPAKFFAVKQQLLDSGTFNYETEAFRKDGRIIHIDTKQSLMLDSNGQPEYVVCVSRDVSSRVASEKVIKESEANLRAIFESTSQCFLLMDADFRIISVNKSTERALKYLYDSEIHKGESYYDFIYEYRKPLFLERMNRVKKGEIVRFEETYDIPGKPPVFFETTYSPVIKDDKVIAIIICAEDKTEYIKSKAALEKSEKKYKALVETSIDLIWTVNQSGTLVFVNQAASSIIGWSPEEIIGRNFLEFVAPEDRERVYIDLVDAFEMAEPQYNYESMILRKDGTRFNALTHAVIQYEEVNGVRHIYLTGTSRDISERIKSERKLNEQNQQLRLLSSYLQTVREDERAHIAREIHDELGQQMTGIKLELSWIHKKIRHVEPDLFERMSETINLIDEAVKTIRKISGELRPALLDNLGLIPAIEWQCQEFSRRTKIRCSFFNKVEDVKVADEVATAIFRVLQESLTNIARHSGARKANVELVENERNYTLKISDNGQGFEYSESLTKTRFGLLGMKERAAMINGSFHIFSIPGKGTEVAIDFPKLNQEVIIL